MTRKTSTSNEFAALISQAEVYGLNSKEINNRFQELISRKYVENGKNYWRGYFSHWRGQVWHEKLYQRVWGKFGEQGELKELNSVEWEEFWKKECVNRSLGEVINEFVIETRYYWEQSKGVNLPHKEGHRIYARFDKNNNSLD